jgi:hypothetical protein
MSNDDDERAKMITAGVLTLALFSVEKDKRAGALLNPGGPIGPAEVVRAYRQIRLEMDREPPRPPHDTGETGP